MMGAAGLGTKEVRVKEENEVMDVAGLTELAALSKLCPQVLGTIRKVREAMYPVSSSHGGSFRELMDNHDLTPG